MTTDLVSALVRLEQRTATDDDVTAVIAAVTAVGEAERARIERDDDASEEDVRVAHAFAGSDLPLTFVVGSLVRDVAAGRRLDATDAACALLAGNTLDPDDVTPLLAVLDRADAGKLHRQSARAWTERGDLDRAVAEAEAMGDLRHIGHRDIGDVHGVRGDAAGFFRHWKDGAASKDRHDMGLRKHRLVAAVARRHGWQAALEVCADKRIGPDFRRTALAELDVAALEEALASLPAGTVSESDRLFLLVDAVVAESPDAPEADHPRLPSLLDEIIALDPTSSKDTMQERNWLLQRLWPAYGDQASLDRAHRAARGPSAKSELGKKLPRDVPRPDEDDVDDDF
jgi:hypothetical protein